MNFSLGKNSRQKEEVVEQLLLEQYDRYYRLAYSYVQNDADACDIVQSGAYNAILNSSKLQNEQYAATWIYRIMLNEIFRFHRQPSTASLDESDYETQGREDIYTDIDLQNALQKLSREDKAVVELRYFEDMKLEDIAEILQENVSTVKSRLYRSIRKLRKLLSVETV